MTMDRRQFLRNARLLAAGVVAADQLDLLDRLGWKRRFFPGWSSPKTLVDYAKELSDYKYMRVKVRTIVDMLAESQFELSRTKFILEGAPATKGPWSEVRANIRGEFVMETTPVTAGAVALLRQAHADDRALLLSGFQICSGKIL